MSDELIDSYVDRSAVQSDTKFLQDQLKTVLDLFDQVNKTKVTLGGTYSLKDLSGTSKEMKKAMDELMKENERLSKAFDDVAGKLENLTRKKKKDSDDDKKAAEAAAKAQERLLFLYTDEAKVQALAREEIRKRNADLKDQIKAESSVAGSIDRAIAANKQLRKERNALDLSTEEGKKRLKELNDEIDRNTEFITVNNDKLTQRKINIGNYVGAAKFIVDAMEAARKKVDQLDATVGSTHPAAVQARKDFEALRNITENPKFLKISANFSDTNQELRFFTKQLNVLEDAGLKNEQVYRDVQKRLAELTDQLGDTRSEIKALASDTRSFDLFASSISFAASVFQTFASAALAAGASEEETAEITKDLVALENFANGIRGVSNELTTKGTAANKLYSFAQAQVAIAMDGTATAAARLRAGLITLGIGALIIGVGLLVANFGKLKAAVSGVTDSQRKYNDAIKESMDTYAESVKLVEDLRNKIELAKQGFIDKKKVVEEYNTTIGNTTGQVKTLDEAEKALAKNADAYIQFTLKKAAANLVLQKAAQLAADAEIANQENIARISRIRTGDKDGIGDFIKRGEQNLASASKVAKEKGVQTLKDIAATLNKEAAQIAKDNKFNFFGTGNEDAEKAADLARKNQQAALEMFKRDLQARADYQKELSQVEILTVNERIKARQKAFDLEKRMILAQQAFDITEKDLTEKQKANIIDEANSQVKKKSEEVFADLLGIYSNFRQRQKESLEADIALADDLPPKTTVEALIEREDKAFEKRKAALEEGRDILIRSLEEEKNAKLLAAQSDEERQRIEEKYNNKRLAQEIETNTLILQAALELAEKKLKLAKDDQATAALLAQIAELKRQLAELKGQKITLDTDEAKNKVDELVSKITKISSTLQEIFSSVGSLIDAGITKRKNAIQEEIDAVEEKKAKDIEVVNQTIQNEEEREAAISAINIRAQVQREALERRQRQLDIERARFEKASTIARIVADTAAAIVAALGAKPYTPANIAQASLIGAIGAAQLAAAIATPLPKFRHGRKDGEATFGVVGDGDKSEVIYSPDFKSAVVTPDHDTVTFIPKGYGVSPSIEDFTKMLMQTAPKELPVLSVLPVTGSDNTELIRVMDGRLQRLETAIMNKQETHFYWSDGELKKAVKRGHQWNNYIQNNV